MNSAQPIGVFDSGFGGLTVVRAIKDLLPNETVVYIGDTARLPYGTKSKETIILYTRQIAAFLAERGVKVLVAACNTASALGVPTVAKEIELPLLGVVEPGVTLAATLTQLGVIGVLGTLGTINSAAYQQGLLRLDSRVVVHGQACPLLVPLVEEGWVDHPVTDQVIAHYLTELRASSGDLDTLVLGCTHYPLLKPALTRVATQVFGHPVTLVDSAEAVAKTVAADLTRRNLLRGRNASPDAAQDQFFFTDNNRFQEVAPRFLGRRIPANATAVIDLT